MLMRGDAPIKSGACCRASVAMIRHQRHMLMIQFHFADDAGHFAATPPAAPFRHASFRFSPRR
jgi:hypothetical protein